MMDQDDDLQLQEFAEEEDQAPLLQEPKPPAQRPPQSASELDAVAEIPVEVSAVLGTAVMPVSRLLKIDVGTTIELSRKVGEAIDIQVNDRIVARGEVVVVDETLGISMTEIIKKDTI